ncbi:head GIN domain-containing protein [Mucilaginibacter panaciglaebae]|uniref:Head GIN domain-containing protein n=1 Tax=Mucilaginibacter panaciglaebae TaxID=502331 RepID=A0ABP7WFA0_9SPHI
MKKAFQTAVVLFGGIFLMTSSCKTECLRGSGHVVTEKRKVADFTKLEISGAYDITLVQDSTLAVSVAADDNLLKEISTDISGGELKIKTGKNICPSSGIAVTIGVHDLQEIEASGAVNLNTRGKLVTKNLALKLSGANKLSLELDAANVTTTASGVSELNLKGQASSHVVNLDGGGKVHAFDFIVGNYDLQTSGASEFEINVLHELTVNSSGASSVKYKGNPAAINSKKSGVSTITKVD